MFVKQCTILNPVQKKTAKRGSNAPIKKAKTLSFIKICRSCSVEYKRGHRHDCTRGTATQNATRLITSKISNVL